MRSAHAGLSHYRVPILVQDCNHCASNSCGFDIHAWWTSEQLSSLTKACDAMRGAPVQALGPAFSHCLICMERVAPGYNDITV